MTYFSISLLIEFGSHCINVLSSIFLCARFHSYSCISFHYVYNLDQWYLSNMLFFISWCSSPTRSRYRELGLKIISLGEDHSHQPKQPPMVNEKRDDGAGDLIKLFLEEALTQ
jgi:hypothetical protein